MLTDHEKRIRDTARPVDRTNSFGLLGSIVVLSEREQALAVWIFELCLRSVMEALLLHAEGQVISLEHHLVGTEPLVKHLIAWLLDCALLQVVVHQLVGLM